MKTRQITRAALIAAVYVALTLALAPVSFGPVQLRLSEALTVLPILTPAAIPGLFVGALVSNAVASPFGLVDAILGSLLTLVAAVLTRRLRRNTFLALLAPVVVNAIGVPAYIVFMTQLPSLPVGPVVLSPYWAAVATIGAGEAVAVFGAGYALLALLRRFAPHLFQE